MKSAESYQISMRGEGNPMIRYTIDGSVPSVFSGQVYANPFEVPVEADFLIKAIAIVPGMKESEMAVVNVRDTTFVKPETVGMVATRPVQEVSPVGSFNLGFEVSPYSSSRQSSDEDNEYKAAFSSLPR